MEWLVQIFLKNPNPVLVGTSKIPAYSSRKRAADADDLNSSSKFNATFNPKASVIQDTRKTSSVPEATVPSQREKLEAFRDKWSKVRENISQSLSQKTVSDSPPTQGIVPESSTQDSEDILSKTTQILDRVKASGEITITKVHTGSQSPVLSEASFELPSTIETPYVQANLTDPPSSSQDREEGWLKILDPYKDLFNSD